MEKPSNVSKFSYDPARFLENEELWEGLCTEEKDKILNEAVRYEIGRMVQLIH